MPKNLVTGPDARAGTALHPARGLLAGIESVICSMGMGSQTRDNALGTP